MSNYLGGPHVAAAPWPCTYCLYPLSILKHKLRCLYESHANLRKHRARRQRQLCFFFSPVHTTTVEKHKLISDKIIY